MQLWLRASDNQREILLSILMYLHILPVEIITKGLIPKIDSDQELQIVNVILLQVFSSSGSLTLHQVSGETEMGLFLIS